MLINNNNNVYRISNGCAAQIKFPALCWDLGWECSFPNLEEMPYDFVVRGVGGSKVFRTVQVKQSYPYGKKKRQRCDIRKSGLGKAKKKYEDGDFDFLAAYNPTDEKWYIIPWKEIKNVKSEINLSCKFWKKYSVCK
ncbi:MAG: hypothetical protein H8E32_00220 [Nitrospinae bacterium]|nr:hypothetical protein [Nitrospinota bacterium]